jgi:hypothetical protein
MTTNAELYPLICEIDDFKVRSYVVAIDNIIRTSTQLVKDDDEVKYLIEVQQLLNREYLKNMKLIENKIKIATQHRTLDLEKVSKLPEDILYEIKSYLAPEVEYARKFGVLQQLSLKWSSYLRPEVYLERDYLLYVPKEIIIKLIDSISIYFGMNITRTDKKERWLIMLVEELDTLIGHQASRMRTDKLLFNSTYNHTSTPRSISRIEKWYRFWLNIVVFKKYRKELGQKKAENADKLKQLKNKRIVIN